MPQISIVKLSELDIRDRIDAEYFIEEYLKIEKKLKKINAVRLSTLSKLDASAFYPAATQLYSSGEIPFVRCVDCIKYPLLSEDNRDFFEKIPKEFLDKNKSSIKIFNNGDLIITKVGTPCFTSIIHDIGKVASSRTVLGLRNIKINPYYLMIFLRSYYGFNQLYRQRELTIQYQLTLDRVGKVLIPLFSESFQQKIELLVNDSYSKLQKSKSLYKEAEEILLKELNLENYKPKRKLTFEAKLNEVLDAERIDADYFQPKYKEIEKKIEEYKGGFDILDNLVKKKKGLEVGSDEYFDEGDKPFYRVSDISINGFSESPKKISEELYEKLRKDFEPKKGEILFTKDGTLGIAYLLDEKIQGILSGAFLRLETKTNFNKECLTLILNSTLCKSQIKQYAGGALISHLRPSEAMNLKIPLLYYQIQNKISGKIQESFKLRKESKELLEKAKKMVEDEIEKEATKD